MDRRGDDGAQRRGRCYRPSVKLAVVIPTLDEAEQVAAAVQSASGPGVEVIVVDGGSRDGTRERAAAAGARVIGIDGAPGRARQLGVGARDSGGDVLLFLHADTRLPPGFAAAVEEALADENTVGGAFRLRFDRRTAPLRVVEAGARLRAVLFGMVYGDQALFVRRSTLEALGGIRDVPIMEDLDLVSAMKRRGRVALLPQEAVTSARRYRATGPLRTALRHTLAALGWWIGIDRARLRHWAGR
jgi:rSAM/selenodomain-associated transferase 2